MGKRRGDGAPSAGVWRGGKGAQEAPRCVRGGAPPDPPACRRVSSRHVVRARRDPRPWSWPARPCGSGCSAAGSSAAAPLASRPDVARSHFRGAVSPPPGDRRTALLAAPPRSPRRPGAPARRRARRPSRGPRSPAASRHPPSQPARARAMARRAPGRRGTHPPGQRGAPACARFREPAGGTGQRPGPPPPRSRPRPLPGPGRHSRGAERGELGGGGGSGTSEAASG